MNKPHLSPQATRQPPGLICKTNFLNIFLTASCNMFSIDTISGWSNRSILGVTFKRHPLCSYLTNYEVVLSKRSVTIGKITLTRRRPPHQETCRRVPIQHSSILRGEVKHLGSSHHTHRPASWQQFRWKTWKTCADFRSFKQKCNLMAVLTSENLWNHNTGLTWLYVRPHLPQFSMKWNRGNAETLCHSRSLASTINIEWIDI